ncbi:MAG: sigma-54 interaction domain-containing protein [Nitrospinaceae bacterium]
MDDLQVENDLNTRQLIKYARELSALHRSEKEKSRQLGETSQQLKKLSQELRETLDELKAKEELSHRLGRILDQTSNEIFLIDPESSLILQANFGARENLGYSGEELSRMTLYDLMPDYSRAEFESLIKSLISGKKPLLIFEATHRRKDGHCYPVEVRLQISQAETHPLFVAVVQDITERKQAYEEIDRLRKQLERENAYLREEVRSELAYGQIIGQSAPLRKMLRQTELVAVSEATVLIQGETGTGKELVAWAIHEKSRRNRHPLVKVNCAAIPRDLFESEFFGHVKGAFSGAWKERTGRFQLAHEGTLFLDEVSEIPLELQGKLLRAIQEGQFECVGGDLTRQVDVRIIAATNRDLEQEVRAGRFREDLYYRLSVVPIEVPPLRERGEDVRLLADHFLIRSCRKLNLKRSRLREADYRLMERYSWPGNVRELQNVIERAVIVSTDGTPRFDLHLPLSREDQPSPDLNVEKSLPVTDFTGLKGLKQLEYDTLRSALEKSNWKVYGPRGAAELLQMKPTTLAYRMKKMGLQRPR